MLNISKDSKLPLEEVKQKSKDYFGQKGLKLELSEEDSNCLTFIGGGGYVSFTISQTDKKSHVEIITKEWEFQVKEFLTLL